MNKTKIFLKLICYTVPFFLIYGIGWASPEELKGEDWQRISRQRKIYYVTASMEEWNARDVIFNHSTADYIGFLDDYLGQHPEARSKNMQAVFKEVMDGKEPVK